MGRAIARTFGARGFDVTLITRDRAEFSADGITVAALPADVLDHGALAQALKDVAAASVASTSWSTPPPGRPRA
jgi:NAD(P)-dependent dehydrogenase (short-subunit alcohol dehydrogenase family)